MIKVSITLLLFTVLTFSQETTDMEESKPRIDSLEKRIVALENPTMTTEVYKRLSYLESSVIRLKVHSNNLNYIYTSGSQIKSSVVLGLMGYGAITVGFLIQLNDDDGSLNKPVIGLNIFGFVCGIVSIFKLYDSGVYLERAGVKSKKLIEKDIEKEKKKEKNKKIKWWSTDYPE